ncbi:FHA domain-containing protein [Neobacillus sp. NPDC097160]|uniref:FHA domain-containing protein n=1 Tax=Neobacillus sp. NPDC097160 TaxID=3364298 RepID=UPI00381DD3B3
MIKQIDLNLENCREYLFFKVNSEVEVARNEIGLLENSQVFGLLSMVVIEKEKEVYFRYDLSSWEIIKPLFFKGFSKERLHKFLLHIIETLIHSKKIGLQLGNIVADKRHIYIDPLSGRPLFFYLPIKTNQYETSTVKEFLLNLLWIAPYDEEDDLRFFIKIHNYLVRAEEIDLLDFKEKLVLLANASEEPTSPQTVPEEINGKSSMKKPARKSIGFYSPGNVEILLEDQNEVRAANHKNVKRDKQTGQKLEIEEEIQYKRVTRTELGDHEGAFEAAAAITGTQINIVPSNGNGIAVEIDHLDEGTTVLGVDDLGTTTLGVAAPMPFLLALATQKKIAIVKDVFKLGRDAKTVDYTSSNKAVGRVHAHILTENGEYFLKDNRSTNGSFVNDIKLAKNEQVKIKHDDRITLANEEFVFRLY